MSKSMTKDGFETTFVLSSSLPTTPGNRLIPGTLHIDFKSIIYLQHLSPFSSPLCSRRPLSFLYLRDRNRSSLTW